MFLDAYIKLVLKHPRKVLAFLVLLCVGLGVGLPQFRLDASADSLVIEGDADLEFSREINARYGTNDFVFVAYTPQQALFSEAVLDDLRALKEELLEVDGVESIDSILDVPLFKVANASLRDVTENIITLESPGIDLAAAEADLTSNAAYLDVLLNASGSSTALVVNFAKDAEVESLLAAAPSCVGKPAKTNWMPRRSRNWTRSKPTTTCAATRPHRTCMSTSSRFVQILDEYRDNAQIVMGGVPMIADDLISFVRGDLQVFGWVILLFIIFALAGTCSGRTRYVIIRWHAASSLRCAWSACWACSTGPSPSFRPTSFRYC